MNARMVTLALAFGVSTFASEAALAQTPPVTPPVTAPVQPAPQPGRGGGGGAGRGGIRVMTLTSAAFADGALIPEKYSQQGRDVSPPLSWSGQPDSTRAFVLMVHDVDAAIGDGNDDLLHWMVWNIPGTVTSLPEGVPQGAMSMMTAPASGGRGAGAGAGAGNNGPRQLSGTGPYYRGPAAPSTGPLHHYLFELYALDANVNITATGLPVPATRAAVSAAMATHIRGKGVLVGLYRRSAP